MIRDQALSNLPQARKVSYWMLAISRLESACDWASLVDALSLSRAGPCHKPKEVAGKSKIRSQMVHEISK